MTIGICLFSKSHALVCLKISSTKVSLSHTFICLIIFVDLYFKIFNYLGMIWFGILSLNNKMSNFLEQTLKILQL